MEISRLKNLIAYLLEHAIKKTLAFYLHCASLAYVAQVGVQLLLDFALFLGGVEAWLVCSSRRAS